MSNITEIMLGPCAAKENYHMIARYEGGKVEILLIESDKARFLSIPTIERYTSRISELEGKVEFYRRETSKLRDYLEEQKIGKPSQKLFDALYEHIAELEAENEKNIKWANDAETRAVAAEERIVELEAENKRLRQEIEDQQVEIIKLTGEMEERRWIPVTERLPDENIYVLALAKARSIQEPGYNMQVIHNSAIAFGLFSHWQPLPQPPKEQ